VMLHGKCTRALTCENLWAGFYVNATEAKWASNYKMYDYVTHELPALINSTFKTTGPKP